jgi:hypothetical protein
MTCSNRVCLVEVREGHGFEYQGRTFCSLNCLHAGVFGRAW